jgi:hypothetical protein
MLRCSRLLPLQVGTSGAFRGSREVPHTYENTVEAPAPAAPRRGGRWDL